MASLVERPRLVVYYGCMFSGKTGEFIRRMRRFERAETEYQAFKPFISTRFEDNYEIRSRDKESCPATPVRRPGEILELLKKGVPVLGIDEAQLFDQEIVRVIQKLVFVEKKNVIVSGLSADFRHEPFGPMPALMAIATEARKFHAICDFRDPATGKKCGDEHADRTQRFLPNGEPAPYDSPIIEVGDGEKYQARCERHHIVPGRPY